MKVGSVRLGCLRVFADGFLDLVGNGILLLDE